MKRISGDICNLESRMRKKIALDLEKELKRQEERKQAAAKKVKIDDSGAMLFCLESIPPNMFHLGNDNFVSVAFFYGTHTCSYTKVYYRFRRIFTSIKTRCFPLSFCVALISRKII